MYSDIGNKLNVLKRLILARYLITAKIWPACFLSLYIFDSFEYALPSKYMFSPACIVLPVSLHTL